MQLSWQPGYSLSRKPVKRSKARPRRRASGDADKPQQFEFIAENPMRSYETLDPLSVSAVVCLNSPFEPTTNRQVKSGTQEGSQCLNKHPESSYPIISDEHGTVEDIRLNTEVALELQSNQTLLIGGDESLDLGTINEAIKPRHYLCTSIPQGVLYSSLSQRFRPVLKRYNGEFCKIPLTSDLQINPFLYRTDLNPEPIFLIHAVMALAGHHVQSTTTQDHRHSAFQLLRESLSAGSNPGDAYSMLDAVIILFSLDETQSAFGNWNTHLAGAYGLLEACGGIKGWATSARAMAQVGILTWWDAITSLVSREDCVFPYTYPEAVLSHHSGRGWDYFGLCGCPPSLVKIVMRLARLSAEKRKSSSMQYVTFDTVVISEIEQSLESWHHVSPETAWQSEEYMQQDQDSMHCSEAWRNGLLLYIYRVFRWEAGSSIPISISCRARAIADHVFACRDESMVSRQALLPLFFAGCEFRDRSLRKRIVGFCSVWDQRTRYHMFSSAIPLLEGVWAKQEAHGFDNVWWGQVVDEQHSSKAHYPLKMRLCFG
ncbi:hypothetical protein FQN49_003848 [Arthroderma sp. PD_2]|nr:hypothetical protein FQN49_003848 [Arthroderma sp. PD_2]